jgi:hypothetical protein
MRPLWNVVALIHVQHSLYEHFEKIQKYITRAILVEHPKHIFSNKERQYYLIVTVTRDLFMASARYESGV